MWTRRSAHTRPRKHATHWLSITHFALMKLEVFPDFKTNWRLRDRKLSAVSVCDSKVRWLVWSGLSAFTASADWIRAMFRVCRNTAEFSAERMSISTQKQPTYRSSLHDCFNAIIYRKQERKNWERGKCPAQPDYTTLFNVERQKTRTVRLVWKQHWPGSSRSLREWPEKSLSLKATCMNTRSSKFLWPFWLLSYQTTRSAPGWIRQAQDLNRSHRNMND